MLPGTKLCDVNLLRIALDRIRMVSPPRTYAYAIGSRGGSIGDPDCASDKNRTVQNFGALQGIDCELLSGVWYVLSG